MEKMELIIATKNSKKEKELAELLNGLDVKVLSLKDFPDMPEVEEDGKSFRANAIKKAVVTAKHTGKICIADDSGLEVKILGNRPGIYSSRFAGEEKNDENNMEKLLRELRGIPFSRRNARFRCAVAIARPDGKVNVVEGRCEGVIALKKKGSSGFGYDPVFIIPEHNKTFAELGPEVKNKISHRARALKKAKKIICGIIKKQLEITN